MEKVQQENVSALDKVLETKKVATDATSRKDNSKRLFSLLLFCTKYTQIFIKRMHSFIDLSSLLL